MNIGPKFLILIVWRRSVHASSSYFNYRACKTKVLDSQSNNMLCIEEWCDRSSIISL